MSQKYEIYKCKQCGQVIEVLNGKECTINCCNEPMELLIEKTDDTGREKHVPVIDIDNDNVHVKVGSVLHPMEPDHLIEFIEVFADGDIYRKELKPGDKPEATFNIKANLIMVRAYCNKHGLWKA